MPMSKFKDAKGWELDAIEKAENEYEKIRRCSDHLKAMLSPTQGYWQTRLNHEVGKAG